MKCEIEKNLKLENKTLCPFIKSCRIKTEVRCIFYLNSGGKNGKTK